MPVCMLDNKTAKKIGVRAKDRISIKSNSKELITIVDITGTIIKKDEILVSEEILEELNLKDNQIVDITLAVTPSSLDYIKKKLDNKKLNKKEIKEIISDIVKNSLSESEIALFVSSMYQNGMNFNETIYLIESIIETGHKLKLNKKLIVDKHSIGGVSGRVTPIVVSICAASGLFFPKTSSRAITSSAGTADAIETIAEVEFSSKELEKIVKKTNACIVWGGGLNMVPADSRIIQVEKMLKIDPEAQLVASIMSKKIAAGSNYIVLHIPYGKYAKVTKKKAIRLKHRFERLGKYFNKEIKCILSKNKGPYGNGVGPKLEMIDVIKVLNPNEKGPEKLEEISLLLAGELLEMTNKAEKNKGKILAKEILYSGKALNKFKEILIAQKGNIKNINKLEPAKYEKTFFSKNSFKIRILNNHKINSIARISGCPTDKSAGVYLHVNSGDKVKKGDKLITIYSESKSRLKQAENYYNTQGIFKKK